MTQPSSDSSPDDLLIVYVTCADTTEARRIGRVLVEERLAACVNIRPHEAIYRWQGAVEEGAEAGMLVKTTRAAWPALRERVVALHSCELPCLVAWTPAAALPAWAAWVDSCVASREAGR